MATSPQAYSPQQKSWIQRHLVAVIAGAVVFVGLVIVAFAFGVLALLGNSEPEKLAFSIASNAPPVIEALGQPIKKGMFSSGSVSTSGPSGHADLKVSISGPKGAADLYLVADRSADQWTFTRLYVRNGDGTMIDLTGFEPPKNSF